MKKTYPAVILGVGFLAFLAGTFSQPSQAKPDTVPTVTEVQPSIKKADDAKPNETTPGEQSADKESEKQKEVVPPLEAAGATTSTNAAATTNATAVTPEAIKPSPALAEVIRLLQGGVSEEIIVAFIMNSAEPFNIGADEILFLHDLGAPPPLITVLIQKDSSPEMMARKQSAKAVKPLPPGVALTVPATNVFASTPPSNSPPTTSPPEPVAVNPPAGLQPVTPVATYTPPAPEVIQEPSYFYDELAPYGSWVEVSGYGRCWRPTVAVWNSSWRPYCDGGRWLWTDCGWYWYSDYSWGWAPFHYGRWTCPVGLGWVWVPDTYWGPSWVSWRYSSSYCGWAPLPPSAHFVAGHGFYHHSVAVTLGFEFGLGCSDYVFVSAGNLCDRHPRYLSTTHANTIYKDTTIVNNYTTINKTTVVNNGAGFDRIQRATRGNIRQVALKGTSEVRNTNTRREVLDAEGKTLTVAQPAKVAPSSDSAGSAAPPSSPAIHPRTERRVATAPSPRESSTSANSGLTDAGNSSSRATFAGSAATSGGSVPRIGYAPRSSSSPDKTPVTAAGTVAPKTEPSKNTPSSQAAHEPKNPYAPFTVRGVTPRSTRNELPSVSGNSASQSRSEPSANVTQPGPVRAPTAQAPAPNQFNQYQPRPRATIPSAPAGPSASPGTYAPPSRVAPAAPHVESRHTPAPAPAPSAPAVQQSAPRAQPSVPAPAPGSRAESYSQSSGGSSSGGNSGGGNSGNSGSFGGYGRRQ
jgi:hypothetical protein